MRKVYSTPETGVYMLEMAHMVAQTGPSTSGDDAKQEEGMDAKRRGSIFSEDASDGRSNGIW